MQQIDCWLRLENATDAGISLCTDDGALNPFSGRVLPHEQIAAQFVRRYGAHIVFTKPSSLDRRSGEAIQDALLDLWLLRTTDFFVGTLGSSFSDLAAYGRPVPAVRTGASTPSYQRQERWLRRMGIYEWLARKSVYEFGRYPPYPQLGWRYLRRLRHLLKRRM